MAHVLIVDDEQSIRISLRKFLEDAGYEVSVAEDADEAQGLLATADCDVVVSDIILPRVTGVTLLKTIKEAAPHVQVILMTGEPTVETASEAVRAGAFDYLAKPITRELVLKTVAGAAKLKALDDDRRRLAEVNRQYRENLERLVDEREKMIVELRDALEQIKTLRGIIPICSHCKKMRDDKGYWHQVEEYMDAHTEAEFSHGICPECVRELYPEDADEILKDGGDGKTGEES